MRTTTLTILCLLIGTGAEASACTVPVFRYALNYWQADEYLLQTHKAKVPDLTYNLNVKEASGEAKLTVGDREVWSGQMDSGTLASLLDSPIRREIISRILCGDSVVWVLVESGDAKKNIEVQALLSARLKYLESIAILPELRNDDPSNRLGPGPALAIRHSILRMSRQDPREAFTLAMLERDPADPKVPIVYPVFGRGRVLIALPQEKVTEDNIDEVAQFLTAMCTCEVKDKRQGWDLLLQVDWEQELDRIEQKRLNEPEKSATTQPATVPSELIPEKVAVQPEKMLVQPETVLIAARSPAVSVRAAAQSQSSTGSALNFVTIAGMFVVLFYVAGGSWPRKRA